MDKITANIFSTPEICNATYKPSISLKTLHEDNKIQVSELKQQTEIQKKEIELYKAQIHKLQEQVDFTKQEAVSAKKQNKISLAIAIISIVADIIIAIFSFLF